MLEDMPLFFNSKADKSLCRHSTTTECKQNKCWYLENLTHHCFNALHEKGSHAKCKGDFLIGYTSKKGSAIYADCECLCHKDKYYSPLSGKWL